MWKTIEERPNYEVSDTGEVRHAKTHRLVKRREDKNGYYCVWLSVKHGVNVRRRVSRLVAQTFVPNPQNLPQVNHKDEDKKNDCVENLEWCDCKYNINYGTRTERAVSHRRKPVIAYKNGVEVARYESASAAARELGLWQACISACCRGRKDYPVVGGYVWQYV